MENSSVCRIFESKDHFDKWTGLILRLNEGAQKMDITHSKKFPKVVQDYLVQVKQFIQDTERIGLVKRVSGPSVYTRGDNWSTLFNAYPSTKENITDVIEYLIRIARGIATNLAGENGVIISATVGKGEIHDQGHPYFEIVQGYIYECYHYESECFAYIRVFQENKRKESESWISFDMDFLEKSAWFNEKLKI